MKLEYGPVLRGREDDKLQARLEAAEKVCREAEEWHWGTHHSKCPFEECLTCQALDNWHRVKEGK